MAMVPVAFAGDSMVQVISMGSILVLFAGLQSKLWPWRTEFANYSDLGMNFGLLLCMMGAAFLVDVREGHGERVLGEFLFFTVILVFAIALGVLGYTAYRRLQPGDRFGVFLRWHMRSPLPPQGLCSATTSDALVVAHVISSATTRSLHRQHE